MMGYICADCGYQKECDVSTSGERLCPDCEEPVTGLPGNARDWAASPPEDEQMGTGDIAWYVDIIGRGLTTVNAHDFEEAAEKAIEKADNPKDIKELKPAVRRYRATPI